MSLRAAALSVLTLALAADEGMWTFDNVPVKAIQARYGFAPDGAWLKRLQLATVRFPGGTGAFVSGDGLVVTNHHVGRGYISQVSTAAADRARDGFTAADRAAEIPVPGLEISILVSMEDVTAQVHAAVPAGASAPEALKARRSAHASLRAAQEAASGLSCETVTLYQGGEYWIYRYRKFKDVRLVAAPEDQVANFGGDPDNYTYPRWNLDFTLFRVYENGQPFRPEAFLPFASTPLKAGDLTFIAGNPGTTFRQQTHAQMLYAHDTGLPFQLAWLGRQRQALEAYARTSPEAARLAADALYGNGNYAKRATGQLLGLSKPENLARVAKAEAALRAQVAGDAALQAQAGSSWDRVAHAVEQQRRLLKAYTCLDVRGCLLLGHALTLLRAPVEAAKPSDKRLSEFADGTVKATRDRLLNPRPVVVPVDQVRLAWALQEALLELGPEHPFVKAALAGRTPEEAARAAVAGTRLHDPAERRRLLEGGTAALAASTDPMLALARILDPFQRAQRRQWEDEVLSVTSEHGGRIAQARFKLLGRSQYPDGTGTLRLGWGPVATYATGSGTLAQPFTTFLGLYDRHSGWGGNAAAAENGVWTLPQRWVDRMAQVDLQVPYNFIYACDTVGGSSGSPVVNRAGEFVGINFDSVFEGQGGYYVYDADTKRAVAVDARAILQALERVMGGPHLARELRGTAAR